MRARSSPDLPPLDQPIELEHGRAVICRHGPQEYVLYIDDVPSSPFCPDDPQRLDFEYLDWMATVIGAHCDQRDLAGPRLVHLGGAGCALPRAVADRFPAARQLIAEPDGVLAEKARAWFALPRAPQLRIRHQDGLSLLASRPPASADVVVRDAFSDGRVPESLTGGEYLSLVAGVLRPGGLYLANVADRQPLSLVRKEAAQALAVFEDVAVAGEPGTLRGRRYANCLILAVRSGRLPDGLPRALNRGVAPARVLTGQALQAFVS